MNGIHLVNPPHPYLRQPKAQAPLGLLYVASAARERDIDVGFSDLSDRNYRDDFDDIPEASLYGITGTILDKTPCHVVAKFLKKRDRRCRIVIGGPITLSPHHIDRSLFDATVAGEGERVIIDIVRDFPRLKMQYRGARIEDLDNLPFPARDLLDGQLGGDVFANRKNYHEGGSTTFVTSRGCPYGCVYCASPKLWGRKVAYRSPENITQEIDEVVTRYGVKQFRFSDDNVTTNKIHLTRLCRHLEGKEIAWRASIRVKPNNIEMFRMMKRGGCTEVCFGIESGDPHILHVLNKKATVGDNYEAIVNAKEAGLAVRILFMCGVPGETVDSPARNIRFLESVKDHYDTMALTNFVPLPGCLVAEQPTKCGCEILDDDVDKFNLCFFGPDGQQNELPNLVRPVGLTVEQLTDNKRRMVEYFLSTGKDNRG